MDFLQSREYINPTLKMNPPQPGVAKLYKRDLMVSSSWPHGRSDTLGKVDQFYIWKADFQK